MSTADGTQTQTIQQMPSVLSSNLDQMTESMLEQKLTAWKQEVATLVAGVDSNVKANADRLSALETGLTTAGTTLDGVVRAQAATHAELRLQSMILGAALIAVALVTLFTWLMQRAQLKRAHQDILHLQNSLQAMDNDLRQQQQAAEMRAYNATMRRTGGAAQPAWQERSDRYPPWPRSETPPPPPPPVIDPVQEILASLNTVLRNPDYNSKVYRLVLENVYGVKGLKAFEQEGTYFGDGSGAVALVAAGREAAYFGYVQNRLLFIFPNSAQLDIAQAPDRIFDGYRLHVSIGAVQRAAVFAPDSGDRWLLQQRGQLA